MACITASKEAIRVKLCVGIVHFKFERRNHVRGNSQLRRHPPRHHPPSSWCLPQIWLQGGILDLFGAHPFWIYPWNYLCCLCHHQIDVSTPSFHPSGRCQGPSCASSLAV